MAEYPTPITHMNKHQLQFICRNKGIDYTAETTQAELVTLIEEADEE